MLQMEAARSSCDFASPEVVCGRLMLPTAVTDVLEARSVMPPAVHGTSIGGDAIVHLVSAAGGEARIRDLREACWALGIGPRDSDNVYNIILNVVCERQDLFQDFEDQDTDYMEAVVKLRRPLPPEVWV